MGDEGAELASDTSANACWETDASRFLQSSVIDFSSARFNSSGCTESSLSSARIIFENQFQSSAIYEKLWEWQNCFRWTACNLASSILSSRWPFGRMGTFGLGLCNGCQCSVRAIPCATAFCRAPSVRKLHAVPRHCVPVRGTRSYCVSRRDVPRPASGHSQNSGRRPRSFSTQCRGGPNAHRSDSSRVSMAESRLAFGDASASLGFFGTRPHLS